MARYVIVGGGHAAGQAAASLRQEGFEGEIVIIGDEAHLPYQRPPLSKQYLSGDQGVDRVLLRAEKFYTDKEITVQLNKTVSAINTADNTVTTASGEVLSYDKLLIATGTRPRKLNIEGSNLGGIHYLRTITDVDGIRAELAPGKKLVIVGGGYIGLEVAAVCKGLGLEVSVLEMESRILQRVTTPKMSEFYHQLHTDRGVNLFTETAVTGFSGTDRVAKVNCADGTSLEADLVIVGIGVIPNIEVAQEAGLDCDNGIVVDETCKTSADNIYAAGDCTNHPNPLLDRRLRLESVPNAMDQARVSASQMCGGDKTYAAIPWFWSDQYELKLQMVGFSTDGDTQTLRGDMASNKFIVFYSKDGKIVAADAVNNPREFLVAKNLVGKEIDLAVLADPATELKSLMS